MKLLALFIFGLLAITTQGEQLNSTDKIPTTSQKPIPTQVKQPFEFKKNALHRIPIFEDRHDNPPVETITNLESLAKQAAATKPELSKPESEPQPETTPETTRENKTEEVEKEDTEPKFELPIPSRCPQITGTVESDKSKDVLAMLQSSSLPKAAQRGCRFFIMHELMQRSKIHLSAGGDNETEKHDEEQHMEQLLKDCVKTCEDAYDNGTELAKACSSGCNKAAHATKTALSTLSPSTDELERESEDQTPQGPHSFSIIIPIHMDGSNEIQNEDNNNSNNKGGLPAMMPNAIRMMIGMMHQMAERARLAMMHQEQQSQPESGSQITQDSGNSISVSRSMSVLVTKDQDGHQKMVVVHSLPKIQIHRVPSSSIFDEDDDEMSPFGEAEKEREEDDLSLDGSEDNFEEKFRAILSGHASRNHLLGENGHGIQQKPEQTKENAQVYYYRSKLCYYLPRLFYITLAILALYVIFWLFCAVPAAFYQRNERRRQQNGGGGVAIIATNNGKQSKKFFFSNNQKYYQLNNKRGSIGSLPPPYPGCEEADPLPEKQPLEKEETK